MQSEVGIEQLLKNKNNQILKLPIINITCHQDLLSKKIKGQI